MQAINTKYCNMLVHNATIMGYDLARKDNASSDGDREKKTHIFKLDSAMQI